jgi:hypothetical protein
MTMSRVDDNIKIAGVSRNTTNNNDTNTSKLVEFLKSETSKTLVEFMKNQIQVKKLEENINNITNINTQKDVDLAKTTKNNRIKENKEEKDNKRDKGTELDIKYCPMNATLADL